jgi:hypothetical protein
MGSTLRPAAVLLVGAALALPGAAGSAASAAPVEARAVVAMPAAPAAPVTPGRTRISDVNGDGLADIVYRGRRMAHPENPDDDTQLGYVAVVYGGGALPAQEVVAGDLNRRETEASFASAVLAADLNRDGYADVVVSDPLSQTADPERLRGKVWVMWGSASGISAERRRLLVNGPDGTGRALAYVPTPSPVLAVGGRERPGGSLRLYPVHADGTLGNRRLISLATPGIPGPPREGSEFGAPLAASGSLLVVGAPHASVGEVRRAGAAYVLRMRQGLAFGVTRISQAGRAVPESPEAGDEFGSSVSVHQRYVAVGAPGEGFGAAARVGLVQSFVMTPPGRRLAAQHVASATQSSLRLPGFASGAGHWWGSSVAVYRPCAGAIGVLAVGRSGVASAARVPLTLAGTCPAAIVATGGFVNHHIGILRTSVGGTTAESTEFTVDEGFLVTPPVGAGVLWPTLHAPEDPAPPAS